MNVRVIGPRGQDRPAAFAHEGIEGRPTWRRPPERRKRERARQQREPQSGSARRTARGGVDGQSRQRPARRARSRAEAGSWSRPRPWPARGRMASPPSTRQPCAVAEGLARPAASASHRRPRRREASSRGRARSTNVVTRSRLNSRTALGVDRPQPASSTGTRRSSRAGGAASAARPPASIVAREPPCAAPVHQEPAEDERRAVDHRRRLGEHRRQQQRRARPRSRAARQRGPRPVPAATGISAAAAPSQSAIIRPSTRTSRNQMLKSRGGQHERGGDEARRPAPNGAASRMNRPSARAGRPRQGQHARPEQTALRRPGPAAPAAAAARACSRTESGMSSRPYRVRGRLRTRRRAKSRASPSSGPPSPRDTREACRPFDPWRRSTTSAARIARRVARPSAQGCAESPAPPGAGHPRSA